MGVYLTNIQRSIAYLPSELELIKKDKTMQKFYVETEGENHSQMLQELAFDEGYCWPLSIKKVRYKSCNYLFFDPNYKKITKSNDKCEEQDFNLLQNYSLKEFKQALNGEYFNSTPDIELFGYNVKFSDNHIKIGCQKYTVNELESVVNVLFGKTLSFDANLEFQLVKTTENKTVPKNKIKEIAEYYDLL